MPNTDKRIDAYIDKAQPFAKPILKHLRKLVHKACPEVQETIKWSFASFDYKGPFCSMAAFKEHAVFGFWKDKLIKDPKGYLGARSNQGGEAMGNLGRLTSLKSLPPDKAILDFIKQAKKLNDEGVKLPAKPKKAPTKLVVPAYFSKAVKSNKKAQKTFEEFSPSAKREYVDWIVEAKSEATRHRRLETAVDWMAQGKIRNWKYVR
ncbi:MAG: YdeI/OmpD-associated family protein [Planctomycetes bacterium]|nr:YdeI/OmpD-associated family protein [Planctomycetota bacterium]